MVPPAQEKSEEQPPGGGGGNRIQEGACLPLEAIKLYVVSKDGSKAEPISGRDLFLKKRVVVIAIPGAFTPGASCRIKPSNGS